MSTTGSTVASSSSALYYHVVDYWLGAMGSNNSYVYTQKPDIIKGPPHSFDLFFGSEENAPYRSTTWYPQDTIAVVVSAAIIFIIRRFIIEKLVAYFTGGKSKTDKRVQENAWFSVYYTVSSVCGYLILKSTPWLFDLDHLIYGYPEEHTGFEYPLMREYLLVGAGFYVQALFTLLFIDEKMKDFWEMVCHHFVTLGLICGCLAVRYHRIGTSVLILHDIVDVFLYSAKASKHIGRSESITTSLFALFVLSFFLLRLVYLPALIVKALTNHKGWDYPARYYLMRYVGDAQTPFEISDYGLCFQRYCLSSYWALILLTILLVCLHVFWFTLISKIIWRKIVGRGLDDIREDDVDTDSDDEAAEKRKQKKD